MATQVVRDFSIMGSTFLKFGNAVELIKRLRPGCPLRFVREPKNAADPNAVIVVWDVPTQGTIRPTALGYTPRGLAAEIAPLIDAGKNVIARKAPNPLHGVCQAAWIPDDAPTETPAPADVAQVTNFEPEVPNVEQPTDTAQAADPAAPGE